MELGGPNLILALIPHNLPLSSDGKPTVPIPFFPPHSQEPDGDDLTPLVLSNVTYPLPPGPSEPKPTVDALQSLLLDSLSSLISATCDLPSFISQGWTVSYPLKDVSEAPSSLNLVTLLFGLLEQRVALPAPTPPPTTPPPGALKFAGKGTKGGAPPAEAPPPPPAALPEPFPPSIRASALRCLSQLARLPSHASEISSSAVLKNLILSPDAESYQPESDMGVVEATALLLHSLLSFNEGSVGAEEAVQCLKRLTQCITLVPKEGYEGQGSIEGAKSAVVRAMMALPDQGGTAFVAAPRPPPPSPPKSPPPPPLATSQFVWDALNRPEMTDGFKLAAF